MQNEREMGWFGYGEADITPDWATELVGFARVDSLSRGVRHGLGLQLLLCQWGKERCAVCTVDSIGFTVALTEALRQAVGGALGLAAERVMVCFSHTHAAPDAARDSRYFALVCQRAVQAAGQALATLAPGMAGWAVTACALGRCRRAHGAVDERLGVLRVDDEAGRLRLLLLRVTAHANVLSSDNLLLSSDYFGAIRRRLGAEYGCPVLVVQGAAGDIRPKFQQENAVYLEIHGYEASQKGYTAAEAKLYLAQSEQALARMAEEAARAVAAVLPSLESRRVYRLHMRSWRECFSADVPDSERARAIAAEAWREAGISGEGWLAEVERLCSSGIAVQQSEIEVQLFWLNEGCLCGVAHEVMCPLALAVWQKLRDPLMFFNGYTGGIDSYLPTAWEYDQGGYEVLWSNLVYYPYHGRVMPLNRDSAQRLVEAVVSRMKRD